MLEMEHATLFHAHFASDPESFGQLIEGLTQAIAGLHPNRDELHNLEILLAEILNNIAEHAYCERNDCPIELLVWRTNGGITCNVIDRGQEMPGGILPPAQNHALNCDRSDLPEGGFGWALVRTIARDLGYERIGGTNVLHFKFTISYLLSRD